MKKQVLLYNIKDKKRALDIRMIMMPLKARVKNVLLEDFKQSLGYVLGFDNFESNDTSDVNEETFSDEMMVLVGFSNSDIDYVIAGFRKLKIPGIPLKAILTETNQHWNAYRLYGDLKKEHEALK